MRRFLYFLKTGMKQSLNRRNLTFAAVVFILSLVAVLRGLDDYNAALVESREFHEAEAVRLKNQLNYMAYAKEGIRVFVVPSATDIFFPTPAVFSQLTARVDTLATVEIQGNCKGKVIFKKDAGIRLRYSVIVLMLGSLAALFLLAEAMNRKEFLKSQVSHWNRTMVYLATVLSRVLFLALGYSLLYAGMVGLVLLHRVTLTSADIITLLHHYGLTLLILLVFALLGALLGSVLKPWHNGGSRGPVLITWLIAVIIIPAIIDWNSEKPPQNLSSPYKLYTDKMNIVNEWENSIEKKYGIFDNTNMQVEKRLVNDFKQRIWPELRNREAENRQKLELGIRTANRAALLTPVTFYHLACGEMSSQGYENYLHLYDLLIRMNREFFLFWENRVYYRDPQEIVSFIKGDENLYKAQGRLPREFVPGHMVLSGYILFLALLSYLLYTRSLTALGREVSREDMELLSGLEKKLKKGMIKIWLIRGDALRNLLYGLLSGKPGPAARRGYRGKLRLEGEDLAKGRKPGDFVYLCKRDEIPPELKVRDLLELSAALHREPREHKQSLMKAPGIRRILGKTVGRLKPREFGEVLQVLLAMGKQNILMLDDSAAGQPPDSAYAIKNKLTGRAEAGSLVIYLNANEMEPGGEDPGKPCYDDGEDWLLRVEANHRRQENRKPPKPVC